MVNLPTEKKYTARLINVSMLGNNTYKILCDDTPIRELTANKEFVDEILALMK